MVEAFAHVWSQPAINPHFPTNGAQIDLLASGLHSAALDTALSHYTALCCLIRCTVHCAALCCTVHCTVLFNKVHWGPKCVGKLVRLWCWGVL